MTVESADENGAQNAQKIAAFQRRQVFGRNLRIVRNHHCDIKKMFLFRSFRRAQRKFLILLE